MKNFQDKSFGKPLVHLEDFSGLIMTRKFGDFPPKKSHCTCIISSLGLLVAARNVDN